MFNTKRVVSVWTLGALVVGVLVDRGVLVLAVRGSGTPAGASQAGGSQYPPVPRRPNVEPYRWSSTAVADECGAATQLDWSQMIGSPMQVDRPFLPVNGKGGEDLAGPYEPVVPWPLPLHSDWRFGNMGGVIAESPDRVYVSQRNELPPRTTPLLKAGYVWGPGPVMEYVKANTYRAKRTGEAGAQARNDHYLLVFDRQGKLIESWDQWNALLNTPTRINISRYDPDRHIWVIEDGAGKIYKFTHDGKRLVMTIDDKDPKGREIGFHGGIAWMPNGDFFVTGTNRVVKFSSEGKYLSEFGSHGAGPGQFGEAVQGLVIHPDTRHLYVGDRPNARMQIFDENGKYLDQWPNLMAVYVLRLSKDGHMWVADSLTHKLLKYDLQGKLLTSFGTFGIVPGAIWGVHYFDTDSEGNFYTVSDYATGPGAIQKWRPRKDVSPTDPRLVGPLVQ